MKKVYTNIEIQIAYLEEQDVLTFSVQESNSGIAEDGNSYNNLFGNQGA